jgi:hypothetical protein
LTIKIGRPLLASGISLSVMGAREMSGDIEDFEQRRKKAADERDRRERQKFSKEFVRANQDDWAVEAFADCFVEILREVNRKVGGDCGVGELERFFKLMDSGAKVHFWTLVQAALARIKPAERYYGDDEDKKREQALLDVALAGLAYLVENGATEQNAPGRKGQRQYKLECAIQEYNNTNQRSAGLECSDSASVQALVPYEAPAARPYTIGRLRGQFCVVWRDQDGKRRRYSLKTTDPDRAKALAPAIYANLRPLTGKPIDRLSQLMIRIEHERLLQQSTPRRATTDTCEDPST